jgi:hypothetical protein
MLHSCICFMSQNSQGFSYCLSHASLERPPRCGCLDHLVNVVDTIGCRPLVYHMYTPKVRVPTKQSQGSDEEWGLTISQRKEQCQQSPQEVANMPTIAMGLHRHSISTRWGTNIFPCCQLPRHLEKKRTRVNNHLN